ncbi:hypothetical protein M885DRAFT_530145, partial [Pelagophyceae sp. CCMP2097]
MCTARELERRGGPLRTASNRSAGWRRRAPRFGRWSRAVCGEQRCVIFGVPAVDHDSSAKRSSSSSSAASSSSGRRLSSSSKGRAAPAAPALRRAAGGASSSSVDVPRRPARRSAAPPPRMSRLAEIMSWNASDSRMDSADGFSFSSRDFDVGILNPLLAGNEAAKHLFSLRAASEMVSSVTDAGLGSCSSGMAVCSRLGIFMEPMTGAGGQSSLRPSHPAQEAATLLPPLSGYVVGEIWIGRDGVGDRVKAAIVCLRRTRRRRASANLRRLTSPRALFPL